MYVYMCISIMFHNDNECRWMYSCNIFEIMQIVTMSKNAVEKLKCILKFKFYILFSSNYFNISRQNFEVPEVQI